MSGSPAWTQVAVARQLWWQRVDPAAIVRSSANGTVQHAEGEAFVFDLDTLVVNAVKPTRWYADQSILDTLNCKLGYNTISSVSPVYQSHTNVGNIICYDALGRKFTVTDFDLQIIRLGQLAITSASPLPTVHNAIPYSTKLAATQGFLPLTWKVVSFGSNANYPPNMALEPGGRYFNNNPVVPGAGSINLTFVVTDARGQSAQAVLNHPCANP